MFEGMGVLVALLAIVVGLLVGLAIGAVILRAAVSLYNRMSGGANSRNAVPSPSFGKAMGIVFLSGLVNMVLNFIAGFGIGILGVVTSADPERVKLVATLISLPIGFLVTAGMLRALLPTSFGRAVLVTLCQYLILIVVVACVIAIVAALSVSV